MKLFRRMIGCSERGATLLEACIAVPPLLFLIFSVVDLSRGVTQYLVLTRAIYESVRFSSRIADLTPTCGKNFTGCQGSGGNETSINRAMRVLNEYGITNASVTMDVSEASTNSSGFVRTYKKIRATVEMPFESITPLYRVIPIRTTITFTDLFRDDVQELRR